MKFLNFIVARLLFVSLEDNMNPAEFINGNKKTSCGKCGSPNNCSLEAGRSITSCWCFGVDIKREIVEDTCLCKQCLEGKDEF